MPISVGQKKPRMEMIDRLEAKSGPLRPLYLYQLIHHNNIVHFHFVVIADFFKPYINHIKVVKPLQRLAY